MMRAAGKPVGSTVLVTLLSLAAPALGQSVDRFTCDALETCFLGQGCVPGGVGFVLIATSDSTGMIEIDGEEVPLLLDRETRTLYWRNGNEIGIGFVEASGLDFTVTRITHDTNVPSAVLTSRLTCEAPS